MADVHTLAARMREVAAFQSAVDHQPTANLLLEAGAFLVQLAADLDLARTTLAQQAEQIATQSNSLEALQHLLRPYEALTTYLVLNRGRIAVVSFPQPHPDRAMSFGVKRSDAPASEYCCGVSLAQAVASFLESEKQAAAHPDGFDG